MKVGLFCLLSNTRKWLKYFFEEIVYVRGECFELGETKGIL